MNRIARENNFRLAFAAERVKSKRSLKTMDAVSMCITVKRQGTS
jgi:hypothetical protein